MVFSVCTLLLLLSADVNETDARLMIAVMVLVIGGALVYLITRSNRENTFRYDDEIERAMQEARALEVVVRLEEAEKKKLAQDLAILQFCQQKIDEKLEVNALPYRYRWELRNKFCKQFQNLLLTRSEQYTVPELTEGQKEEVLKSHPLLSPIADSPPDPSKTFSDEDWYRDIRAKANQFAARLYSGSDNSSE